jgi:hypothetical protein
VPVDAINFAPPEISLRGMFRDPAFLILLVDFFALSALSFLHTSGRRFMKKQTDYQQAVNEKGASAEQGDGGSHHQAVHRDG